MSGEIPKMTKDIAALSEGQQLMKLFFQKDQAGNWTRLPESLTSDFKYFRPTRLDPKLFDPKLFQSLNLTISRSFTYGPNPIANYRNEICSGASATSAAWWALRGTAGYYYSAASALVGRATATLLGAASSSAQVMAAGALGFAGGVVLDRGQEALFGESYTAAGVKAFLENPAVWGSAEAAPKQLIDAWDNYFAWTNIPDQAIGWLKKNLS